MKVDFLIVGSGLFGAVCAQQLREKGKTCVVIDKRTHIAGNCYSEKKHNIDVHVYGPHIFQTNNEKVWSYVQRFSKFKQYAHKVKVNWGNQLYSFPINLQTMYEIYGVRTPAEAMEKLEEVRVKFDKPNNLEEHCLSMVGWELYNVFVKGYTTKQWGKSPKDLPASIIKRLPVRMNFDDRYHQSEWSGIPDDGYTILVSNMLDGIKVELGVDFFKIDWKKYAEKMIYTGPIDALFDYTYGDLEYRTLRFEEKVLDGDYQGIAQINYADERTPFTRTTEHKHFNNQNQDKTVVTWEFPERWAREAVPYYPVNTEENQTLYKKYKEAASHQTNIVGGGRLYEFAYLDMDYTIASALNKIQSWLS